MVFEGMDVDLVAASQRQLAAQASVIDQLLPRIDGIVREMLDIWHGPVAEEFHGWWVHQHRPALGDCARGVREMCTAIHHQVGQQDVASSLTGAVTGHDRNMLAPRHPASATELLDLADASYHDPNLVVSNGHTWTAMSDSELRRLHLDPADFNNDKTGFHAVLYRSDDGNYVLAYRGTRGFKDGPTWESNLISGSNLGLSPQSEQAVNLALSVHAEIPGVTFTGHSAGGKDAALASVATGQSATTFNAEGVSGMELSYARTAGGHPTGFAGFIADSEGFHGAEGDRITAYTGENDVLNNLQDGVHDPSPANPAGALLGALGIAPEEMGVRHSVDSSNLDPFAAHGTDDLKQNVPIQDT